MLDYPTHRFEVGPRVVDHPLRQRLTLNVFGNDVDKVALAGLRKCLEDMGVGYPPRDPLFHHKAFQIFGVFAQID